MDIPHPNVSWVMCRQLGADLYLCWCTACQQRMAQPGSTDAANSFAELHSAHESASSSHFGLGDLIAKLTGKVGLRPCTACERRRRQLNGLAPRVFRR